MVIAIGTLLFIAGAIAAVAFHFTIVLKAFEESAWWGIACLGPGYLIYVFANRGKVWRIFAAEILATLVMYLGAHLAGLEPWWSGVIG